MKSCKSKIRQYNGHKKGDKRTDYNLQTTAQKIQGQRTNNDLQSIAQKTKYKL